MVLPSPLSQAVWIQLPVPHSITAVTIRAKKIGDEGEVDTEREIKHKKEWYKLKQLLTNGVMPGQSSSSSSWPTFPLVLLVSRTPHGVEHPLGQLGSAVPGVSPPSPLCTPSLLSAGVGWEALCKHCSATTQTFLYYQHNFQHKSEI